MYEANKMERKEVDTQQFIDHTLLASELMRDDPNTFIMELMDPEVFPKTEGPTNLTTNGSNTNNGVPYNEKDTLTPELSFHNTIFQFVHKHVVDEPAPRPSVSPPPERTHNYNNTKETDVEFLTLNSSFLNAATVAAAAASNDSELPPVPQVPQPQSSFPALAIEPTVPIDVTNALQDEKLLYAHNASTTNARKVLPHKKRISRKLKGTLASIEASPSNTNGAYDLDTHKHVQVVPGGAVALYSCEICGYAVHTQLDFFAHLKQHYEPTVQVQEQRISGPHHQQQQPQHQQQPHQKEPLDMCDLTSEDKLQQEQAKLDQVFQDVQLNFENFHNITHVDDVGVDDVGVNMVIHSDAMSLHKLSNDKLAPVGTNNQSYVPTVTERALLKSAANDVPVVDDVEFSDTEDMLEGIRNVVDKVSIEDTCDELDLELTSSGMRAPWFNNNFSDIAFSGPLSQLLLPGEPPPAPINKPNDSAAEHITLNFLNTSGKRAEPVITKLESHKKDEGYRATAANHNEAIERTRPPTPIEELQRSPLLLNEPFKLENVEVATVPAAPELSDSLPLSSPADSVSSQPDTNGDDFLLGGTTIATKHKQAEATPANKTSKKVFRCEKCVRDFNSYNALKYHNHTHTQQRSHKCDICERCFYTLSALKAHERTHSDERPFSCEYCETKFRQWGDLKYHVISRHSETKSHMCEYCGKSFSRKYSLVVHRRIHTSERNYSCVYCDKSFRASSYLLSHIKVHTGEKPYSCTLCDKKFRVSGDLKRHMRVHEKMPKSSGEPNAKKVKKRTKLKTKQFEVSESEHDEILGL